MISNQRQSFRFRLNQDEDNQSRFSNNERFDKAQFVYQISVENEKKENENVDKNSNSYYHEKNENENWTKNAEFYNDDLWNYNDAKFDVNFVTSANMMSAIHVCQKCSTKFIFRNKFFKHLRVECWQFESKSDVKFDANHASVTSNAEKSIVVDVDFQLIKFIVTSVVDNDYVFRESHYVTALIKEARDEEIVSCCLDIDCFLTIENRVYVKRTFFIISIRQLIASLSVRSIDNNIHSFNEYVVVDLFMNDHVIITEKKTSATNRFSIEIHIVDELKINLLIDNDVLNVQRMSLDLKFQTTILANCHDFKVFIDIIAKKNFDQRRIIRSKVSFKISAKATVQMSMSYHDNLSNDRDFLFEFQCNQFLDLNENVFAHIVNASLDHVMMRNIIQHSVTLQKRVRLKTLIDYNQQRCYNLTSNVDFLVIDDWKITKQHQRIWKNKLDMIAAAAIYAVFLTTNMISSSFFTSNTATNVDSIFDDLKTSFFIVLDDSKTFFFIVIDSILKHVMSNDVIIYDESNIIACIAEVINVYSAVWNDQNIIVDIFEKQWMSIILKSNVEVLKSTRMYSIESKNRAIIDVIFDKMHKKDKMT